LSGLQKLTIVENETLDSGSE